MMAVAVITLALLVVNAIFVAAEFAIIGSPRPAVEHRARQGDSMARRLLAILTSPPAQDRYIAAAQLGISLASLGLGMYGEHTLAVMIEPALLDFGLAGLIAAHTLASVIAVALLTYLHIFIGEMIPKAVALSHPETSARLVYWPMRVTMLVFYPFVIGLNAAGNLLLRLVGIRRQENPQEVYTPEELQLIVEESALGGALRAESGAVLRELFEFGDRTAGEVMVPRVRVVGIPVGATTADVREILLTKRHTRYPVYDGDLDHIVGMLHVKDLLRRLLTEETIGAADARPMPVVPETATLDVVLGTMQRTAAHMAIVIDEHGGTAGLVSLEDLFEEVVGELDEGVPASPPLLRNPDGSYTVAGTLRLDELGQAIDLELEHEDVDSISGLVLAGLGRPPVVGDAVEHDRIRVEVTQTTGRGVKEARVTVLAPRAPRA
jgi:CBS domain containing-hemolysin-like protein